MPIWNFLFFNFNFKKNKKTGPWERKLALLNVGFTKVKQRQTKLICHTSRPTATISKNSWLYLTNNNNVSVYGKFLGFFNCLFWPNALCTAEAFYSFGTWKWYTNKKRHFEVVKVVNKWLLTTFLTSFLMNALISLLTCAQALALVNIHYQNLTYLSVCCSGRDLEPKRCCW